MYQGQHPGNKSFVIIDSFLTNILYIVDKKLLDKKKNIIHFDTCCRILKLIGYIYDR